MNTWLAARDRPRVRSASTPALRAFVAGGVAPDVPLYLLSAGSLVWYGVTQDLAPSETFDHIFNNMFFENTGWKILNTFFHSPFVLLATWGIGRALSGPRGATIRAFAVGCALHAGVDIVTHHSDGPLLFFPFDLDYRFPSPVSYYEPEHHGRVVGAIDLAITVGLGLWSGRRWLRTRTFIGPTATPDD